VTERLPARYEDKREDFWVKNFAAMNTQADRTAIADNEFAWLENVMPVGPANLRVVPYQGSVVGSIPSSSITYWRYANISNTDYMMCFTSAGGAQQIKLSDGTRTQIAPAATFTGTVAMAQWKNERILIIASNGYWDWDGATLTSRGGVTSAPSAGSTIATFAGRVWIGNGRTISYSAPNSFSDFQAVSAGGSTIITDETFKSNIYNLFAANNFLYVFGDSAINVISDVRVSGTTTLFSNTNVTANFGTTMPLTVFPYYRTLSFGTPMGFYGLYGSTPQKMSDALDGIFESIQFANTVSGGVAKIYNILCAAYLFQYADPLEGVTRALLALTFNKKWFVASQGDSLTMIGGAFLSGVPVLYGTDGTQIWKLFSDTTTNIDWSVKTALWSLKDPIALKQTLKGGIELTASAQTTSVDVDVVSEIGTTHDTFSNTNEGQWVNAAGTEGAWENAALEDGDWLYSGFSIYQANIEAFGRYIGYNISSSAPGTHVNGLLLEHERKARWTARA
jgi:hypothetical protein